MKHGMEVGLDPGHIVLDGNPAPPKRGTAPHYLANVYCGHTVAHVSALVNFFLSHAVNYKNSSGDEIANVTFFSTTSYIV